MRLLHRRLLLLGGGVGVGGGSGLLGLGRSRRGRHVGGVVRLTNGGRDLVGAVLLDELGQVFDCAGSDVLDGGVFGTSGEELDCGEALDLFGDVVGGGVDLGDGDLVGGAGEGAGQFLILGSEAKG